MIPLNINVKFSGREFNAGFQPSNSEEILLMHIDERNSGE